MLSHGYPASSRAEMRWPILGKRCVLMAQTKVAAMGQALLLLSRTGLGANLTDDLVRSR